MPKEIGIRLTADNQQALKAIGETEKQAASLGRMGKQITNDGADVPALYKKIGEVGGQAFKDLISTMQAEGKSLKEIRQAVVDLAAEKQKAARQSRTDYIEEQKLAAAQTQNAKEARDVIKGMTQSVAELGNKMENAAKSRGAMERSMRGQMGAEGAAKAADDVVKIASASAYSKEQVATVAKELQRYGAYSREALGTVANLAEGTGQSFERAGQLYGQLAKGGDAAAEAGMALSKEFGISAQEMKKFGAVIDDQGRLFTNSAESAQKAKLALDALVKSQWSDAAKQGQSATDELNKKLEEFEASCGKSTVAAKTLATQGLIAVVDTMNELPGPIKTAIGVASSGVGAFSEYGGKALELGANIGILKNAFPGVEKAMTSFGGGLGSMAANAVKSAGPIGVVAALMIALGIGANATIKEYESSYKALDAAQTESSKKAQLAAQAHRGDWAHKSAQQLHELGLTHYDVAKAVAGYNEQIEDVKNNQGMSNEEKAKQIARLQQERDALRQAGNALGEYDAKLAAAAPTLANTAMWVERASGAYKTQQGTLDAVTSQLQSYLAALEKKGPEKAKPGEDQNAKDLEHERTLNGVREQIFQNNQKKRQNELQSYEMLKGSQSELARQQLDSARAILRAHEDAGTATIRDHERVRDAGIASAKKELSERKQAIKDKEDTDREQGLLTTNKAMAYANQRKAAYMAYYLKEKELAQETARVTQEAEAKKAEYARNRINASLQANSDETELLEQYRKRGMDVENSLKDASLRRNQLEIAAEMQTYQANMKRLSSLKDAAGVQNEQARHQEAMNHLAQQNVMRIMQLEEQHNQHLADRIQVQKDAAAAAVETAENEIKALEDRRKSGANVEAEMEAAIRKSNAARLESIRLEKEQALRTNLDPSKNGAIESKAAEDTKRANQEMSESLRKNHADRMSQVAAEMKARKDTMSLQEQAAEQELSRLEELAEKGLGNEAALKNAIEARYSLQVKGAEQAAAAERAEASTIEDPVVRTEKLQQIELQLKLSRDKASHDRQQSLEKEAELLKKITGFSHAAMSITEAFANGNYGFSIDKGLGAATTGSPTVSAAVTAAGGTAPSVPAPTATSTTGASTDAGAAAAAPGASATIPSSAPAATPSSMSASVIHISAGVVNLNGPTAGGASGSLARDAFFTARD